MLSSNVMPPAESLQQVPILNVIDAANPHVILNVDVFKDSDPDYNEVTIILE